MLSDKTLTNREKQVLALISVGQTPTEVGKTLQLSRKTVSTYKLRIAVKLGLESIPPQGQLVTMAKAAGWC